jgi:hypothetical protein
MSNLWKAWQWVLWVVFVIAIVNALPTVINSEVTSKLNGTASSFNEFWDVSDGNLSGYIFSWDNSGEMQNDSWLAEPGPWTNTSKTLNETPGAVLHFKVFVNDSGDVWYSFENSFVIAEPFVQTYGGLTCPTSSLPVTLIFIFFGLIIAGVVIFGETRGMGIALILAGILTIAYSIPFYACSIIWGLFITVIGLFIITYAIKLKQY